MVSYFVRYTGAPADPEAFASYYRSQHAAILREFPKIRALVLHRPLAWSDPFPVSAGDSFLIAQMTFESPEDLDEALRSEARRRAREDFAHLPAFSGHVSHQAMQSEVLFR